MILIIDLIIYNHMLKTMYTRTILTGYLLVFYVVLSINRYRWSPFWSCLPLQLPRSSESSEVEVGTMLASLACSVIPSLIVKHIKNYSDQDELEYILKMYVHVRARNTFFHGADQEPWIWYFHSQAAPARDSLAVTWPLRMLPTKGQKSAPHME